MGKEIYKIKTMNHPFYINLINTMKSWACYRLTGMM